MAYFSFLSIENNGATTLTEHWHTLLQSNRWEVTPYYVFTLLPLLHCPGTVFSHSQNLIADVHWWCYEAM